MFLQHFKDFVGSHELSYPEAFSNFEATIANFGETQDHFKVLNRDDCKQIANFFITDISDCCFCAHSLP